MYARKLLFLHTHLKIKCFCFDVIKSNIESIVRNMNVLNFEKKNAILDKRYIIAPILDFLFSFLLLTFEYPKFVK